MLVHRSSVVCLLLSFTVGTLCTRVLHRAARRLRRARPALASTAEQASQRVPLQGAGTPGNPRVAADAERGQVLIDEWLADEDIRAALSRGETLRSEPLQYASEASTPLYGRLVWAESAGMDGQRQRPGALLVHTAVGPHDLFLHWKAEALASLGFAVMVVDMFGDSAGSAWDKDWSLAARAAFKEDRSLFLKRMQLAMGALSASPLVDSSRVAALGYCFGGPAVLDFARADPPGLLAAIIFHGTLDANPPPVGITSLRARLLICHAEADPFVSRDAFDACTAQLVRLGARWSASVFGGGVVHSFTNPAQRLNSAPEFDYDAYAARASWLAAKELLQDAVYSSSIK